MTCKCKDNPRTNNYGQCIQCGKKKGENKKPQFPTEYRDV